MSGKGGSFQVNFRLDQGGSAETRASTSAAGQTSVNTVGLPSNEAKIADNLSDDLFSMDRANAVISHLMKTVQEQGKRIQVLERQQNATVSRQDVTTLFTSVQGSLASLDARVKRVEQAINLSNPSEDSIGNAVSATRRAVARSLDVVSAKADKSDVRDCELRLKGELATASRAIVNKCGSRETLDRAVDTVSSLQAKVKAVETNLGDKVDGGELDALRLDAALIREKAREIEDILGRVNYVEREFLALGGRMEGVEEVAVGTANRTVLLGDKLGDTANRADFEELRDVVLGIKEEVNGRLTKRVDFERISKVVEGHGRKVATLGSAFDSASELARKVEDGLIALKREVVTKGELKSGVSGFVKVQDFNDSLARVRVEVDAKAWAKEFMAVRKEHDCLKKEHDNATRVKADLAARFVEWYGAKGEAYESNLHVVDGHLKNLALQGHADGATREPYT